MEMHHPSALVQLSQIDGCEPQLFCQVFPQVRRAFVVALKKDHPVTFDMTVGKGKLARYLRIADTS
jgi:hypothetical protein